jgi:hypothetical protein
MKDKRFSKLFEDIHVETKENMKTLDKITV